MYSPGSDPGDPQGDTLINLSKVFLMMFYYLFNVIACVLFDLLITMAGMDRVSWELSSWLRLTTLPHRLTLDSQSYILAIFCYRFSK